MKKTCALILILICFSCQKQTDKTVKRSGKTNSKFINFNDYIFNTTSGSQQKISLKDDKKYILDFWYLECAPCVKQHKEIAEYQDKLKKNNIEIIGISIDRSTENWNNYLQKHQYNWPNYNQYSGDNVLKNDLGIKLFPRYLIVDAKGNIDHTFNSFQKVIQYLNL